MYSTIYIYIYIYYIYAYYLVNKLGVRTSMGRWLVLMLIFMGLVLPHTKKKPVHLQVCRASLKLCQYCCQELCFRIVPCFLSRFSHAMLRTPSGQYFMWPIWGKIMHFVTDMDCMHSSTPYALLYTVAVHVNWQKGVPLSCRYSERVTVHWECTVAHSPATVDSCQRF